MTISEENAKQIAGELKDAIGKDINVIAPDGKILASTDSSRVGKIHEGARKLVQDGLDKLAVYDTDSIGGAREGINLPITIDGETVGVIGITGKTEEVSPLGTVIKKMTEIMLQNARRQQQQAAVENARNIFAERWLYSSDEDTAELPSGEAVFGITLTVPRVIAVLEGQHDDVAAKLMSDANSYIKKEIAKTPDSAILQIHGRTVIVLNSESPAQVADRMEKLLEDVYSFSSMSMRCGVSSVSRSEQEIRKIYSEAKAACAVAFKLSSKKIAMYNECSPEMILQSIAPEIKKNFREQIFASCSKENSKLFLETLKAYFEYDGNIEKVAEHFFVHKNTIYYRIEQIKKQTGYKLTSPRDVLMLYVAACGDLV